MWINSDESQHIHVCLKENSSLPSNFFTTVKMTGKAWCSLTVSWLDVKEATFSQIFSAEKFQVTEIILTGHSVTSGKWNIPNSVL